MRSMINFPIGDTFERMPVRNHDILFTNLLIGEKKLLVTKIILVHHCNIIFVLFL